MARPDYDLNTARDGDMVSSNGTAYTINILWTGATDTTDMAFGPSGVEISYETPDDKTKNSYILTSKCTIPFLVQNDTDKAFILSLATTYQEREVWITVRKTTGADVLLWCGYVILDLKDEQDVSYPYEVSLTAIDGLSALKEMPFVRETNLDTGAVPTFPYVTADTYYNAGFSNIIAGSTSVKWLSELITKTGMVLADDGDGATFLENYTINTAVNVYNEGHPAPGRYKDPLRYSQINAQILYSLSDENYVTVPNCYTVLEYICKSFGMRCVYWHHSYHFIQINEYNTDAYSQDPPIDLPTRIYYYNGAHKEYRSHIGATNSTPYDLVLENETNPGAGLQKLAGTIYSGLPAIKTVNSTYYSDEGTNVYRGMPLFTSTWDTTGNQIVYNRLTVDGASNTAWGTLVDAADANGIKFECYLSYKNTTTTTLFFRTLFILVAKPSSQTATVGTDTKVCIRDAGSGEYVWTSWTSGTQPRTGTTALHEYARNDVYIPPSPTVDQNVGILAYETASDGFSNSDGCFPIDAAFTGSWDFAPITITCYDSNAGNPLKGFYGQFGGLNYGSTLSHGQIFNWTAGGQLYDGTALNQQNQKYKDIDYYQYDYDNAFSNSGSMPYMGTLQLQSNTNNIAILFEVDVVNKNSYVLDAGDYFWGDGQTIKVSSDGTNYVYASADGKWTQPTYVWNGVTFTFDYTVGAYDKKLVELVMLDIVYNQSIPLKQFNGTTALSETDRFISGTSLLKYMNPIAKLTDTDNTKYQLMRGTFNMMLDQWDVTMNQINYEVPSDTINVTQQQVAADLTPS